MLRRLPPQNKLPTYNERGYVNNDIASFMF